MELVSVIVPVYNSAGTIKNTLTSILNQSYRNIEVLVINDGSTDSSQEIIESICSKDSRVSLYNKNNSGVSDSRNYGLKNSNGSYILFVDSDDLVEKNYISRMMESINSTIDLVCCGYILKKDNYCETYKSDKQICDKSNYDLAIKKMLENKLFNVLWNKLFRKSIIRDNNLSFIPGLNMAEDLLFVLDYLFFSNGSIQIIDDVLYTYYFSNNGLQGKYINKKTDEYIEWSAYSSFSKLYEKNGYAIDDIIVENMRYMYTSLLLNPSLHFIKSMLKSRDYDRIRRTAFSKYSKRFRIFLLLLKMKNAHLILLMIKIQRRRNKLL